MGDEAIIAEIRNHEWMIKSGCIDDENICFALERFDKESRSSLTTSGIFSATIKGSEMQDVALEVFNRNDSSRGSINIHTKLVSILRQNSTAALRETCQVVDGEKIHAVELVFTRVAQALDHKENASDISAQVKDTVYQIDQIQELSDQFDVLSSSVKTLQNSHLQHLESQTVEALLSHLTMLKYETKSFLERRDDPIGLREEIIDEVNILSEAIFSKRIHGAADDTYLELFLLANKEVSVMLKELNAADFSSHHPDRLIEHYSMGFSGTSIATEAERLDLLKSGTGIDYKTLKDSPRPENWELCNVVEKYLVSPDSSLSLVLEALEIKKAKEVLLNTQETIFNGKIEERKHQLIVEAQAMKSRSVLQISELRRLNSSIPSHRLYLKDILGIAKVSAKEIDTAEVEWEQSMYHNTDNIKLRGEKLLEKLGDTHEKLGDFISDLIKEAANLASATFVTPITRLDVRAMLLYGSIVRRSPNIYEFVHRFISRGSKEVSVESISNTIKSRQLFEQRLIHVESELEKRPGNLVQVRQSERVKFFVLSDPSTNQMKEDARRLVAKMIKHDYVPFETMLKSGGTLNIKVFDYEPRLLLFGRGEKLPCHSWKNETFEIQVELEDQVNGFKLCQPQSFSILLGTTISIALPSMVPSQQICAKVQINPAVAKGSFQHSMKILLKPYLGKPFVPISGGYSLSTNIFPKANGGILSVKVRFHKKVSNVKVFLLPESSSLGSMASWGHLEGDTIKTILYPDHFPYETPPGIAVSFFDKDQIRINIPWNELFTDNWKDLTLPDQCPLSVGVSFASDSGGFKRSVNGLAVTTIASRYRGWKVRSKVSYKKMQLDVRCQGLLSTSPFIQFLQGDRIVGCSKVARHAGVNPQWVGDEVVEVLVQTTTKCLSAVIYESATESSGINAVGKAMVSLSNPDWVVLEGGSRAMQGKLLNVYLGKYRLPGSSQVGQCYSCKVNLSGTRPKLNKCSTSLSTMNNINNMAEWQESIFLHGTFNSQDFITFSIFGSEPESPPVSEFHFECKAIFEDPNLKWRGWIQSHDAKLFIKCSVDEHVTISAGKIQISNIRIPPLSPPRELLFFSTPKILVIKVIEATDLVLGELAVIKPYVTLCTSPCVDEPVKTASCYSDGKHAKWTKQENNSLCCTFSSGSSKITVILELKLDQYTILDSVEIPAQEILESIDAGPKWFSMKQAKIRLSISPRETTRKEPSDRIHLSMQFIPSICFATVSAQSETTNSEETHFFTAIRNSNHDKIEEMLQGNASLVNAINIHGKSPLHVAVIKKDDKLVDILLVHGAETSSKDREGKSPAEYSKNIKLFRKLGVLESSGILVSSKSQICGFQRIVDSAMNAPKQLKGMKIGLETQVDIITKHVQTLATTSSYNELFSLFDSDDNGFVDQYEFEGSLKVILGISTFSEIQARASKEISSRLFSHGKECSRDIFFKVFGVDEEGPQSPRNNIQDVISNFNFGLGTTPADFLSTYGIKITLDEATVVMHEIQIAEDRMYDASIQSFLTKLSEIPGRRIHLFKKLVKPIEFSEIVLSHQEAIKCISKGFPRRFNDRLCDRLGLDKDRLIDGQEILAVLSQKVSDIKITCKNFVEQMLKEIRASKDALNHEIYLELFRFYDVDGSQNVDFFEFSLGIAYFGIHDSSVAAAVYSMISSSLPFSLEDFSNFVWKFSGSSEGSASINILQKRLEKAKVEIRKKPASVLLKSNRDLNAPVNWRIFLCNRTTADIIEYTDFTKTMTSSLGSIYQLGKDRILSIANLTGESDTTFARVQSLVLSLLELEECAVRTIQKKARSKFQIRDACKIAEKLRHEKRFLNRESDAAISIQSLARSRFARERCRRLSNIRERRMGKIRKAGIATTRLQARFRGHLVRSDTMNKRNARQQMSALTLQAIFRGFLIRSSEKRTRRQENQSIIYALREKTLGAGFESRIEVNAPKLSKEKMCFDLLFAPCSDLKNQSTGLHALFALEAHPAENKRKDGTQLISKVEDLLKCYGIQNSQNQLGDIYGEHQSFRQMFLQAIQNEHRSAQYHLFESIASKVSKLFPVHDPAAISAKIQDLFLQEEGYRVTSTVFSSFKFIRSTQDTSFCWIQIPDQGTSAKRYRALELQEARNGKYPPDMKDVIVLAIAVSKLDFVGFSKACFGSTLELLEVKASSAVLMCDFNDINYKINLKLVRDPHRHTRVSNSEIPQRELCESVEIESILISEKDSILEVSLSGTQASDIIIESLEKAIWLPPINAPVFNVMTYSAVLDVNIERHIPRDFETVSWFGRLRFQSGEETSEEVVVIDGYRTAEDVSRWSLHVATTTEEPLGWFDLNKCKKVLSIDLQVDEYSDDFFVAVVGYLAPYDQSANLLTNSLRHVRETLGDNNYRSVFQSYAQEDKLTQTCIRRLLTIKCTIVDQFRILTKENEGGAQSEILLQRLLDIFPNPAILDQWMKILNPPNKQNLEVWLKRLMKQKSSCFLYLRAKFKSEACDGLVIGLPVDDLLSIVIDYFEEEHLNHSLLKTTLNWAPFTIESTSSLKVVDFSKWLGYMQQDKSNVREKVTEQANNLPDEPEQLSSTRTELDAISDSISNPSAKLLAMDDEEQEYWGEEFLRNKTMMNALGELRFIVLEYAAQDGPADLEKSFRVFDRDGTGVIDLEEFKGALITLGIESLLPLPGDVELFMRHADKDGDNGINYKEFKALIGNHQDGFPIRQYKPKTIRWAVEVYLTDIEAWMSGVAKQYREEDNAINIDLEGRRAFPAQNIGFLQLDDYPVFLKRNLWSGKPWGSDHLFRSVVQHHVNTKTIVENNKGSN